MSNFTDEEKEIILNFLRLKIKKIQHSNVEWLSELTDQQKLQIFENIPSPLISVGDEQSKLSAPMKQRFFKINQASSNCEKAEKEKVNNLVFKSWIDEATLYNNKNKASQVPTILSEPIKNKINEKNDIVILQNSNKNEYSDLNSQKHVRSSHLDYEQDGASQNKKELPDKINVSVNISDPNHKKRKDFSSVKNLKNGMIGQEYSEKIDLSDILYGLKEFKLLGLCEIGGLEFNPESKEIFGNPKKAGLQENNFEFNLKLVYNTYDDEKEREREFNIKIFPDPKSLWKDLEPDEKLGYAKTHSDSMFEEFQFDNLSEKTNKIVIASKRGRSHAHTGLYRDDDFKHKVLENGWLVLAVADGAGSCKYSRHGSRLACNKAVDFLEAKLKEEEKEKFFYEIIRKIDRKDEQNKEMKNFLYNTVADSVYKTAISLEQEAEKMSVKLKELSTTILICIIKKTEIGFFIAGFWIGDGALCIYESDSNITMLGKSDGGEFAGQTRFITTTDVLTSTELSNRLKYKFVDDFKSVFVMSDGVSDPKFITDNNLEDIIFWNNLYQELFDYGVYSDTSGKTLLNWLDFWAEGNHDDRTIAIVY